MIKLFSIDKISNIDKVTFAVKTEIKSNEYNLFLLIWFFLMGIETCTTN